MVRDPRPLRGALIAWLIAAALPATAQDPSCQRLTEQLLEQLSEAPTSAAIDAMAVRQRSTLTANGCNPQTSGYELEVEELKLNADIKPKQDDGPAIRLDQLLRITY